MKSAAQMYVWWPTINQDIEKSMHECERCQQFKKDPAKAPSYPWEKSCNPWKQVHIDFNGPFKVHMWLILVDTFTKWPEVIKCQVHQVNVP